MRLEEKLRQLKQATVRQSRDAGLEDALQHLRRLEKAPKKLPAKRVPKGIEAYVEGQVANNRWGEFFLARQALPFGRPYGKLRIGDVSTADLSPLDLFLENASLPPPEQIVYLDTETTGLAGGTGTCAFLVGIGAAEGSQFVVRQFFLRDYPEEKAMLAALTEALKPYQGLVTFNGKTFDVPLLETRYALARLKSPLTELLHVDLLHPARRLWKLRLETCELTHLEREVLGVSREGDVSGSEIPGIYFDYLRAGDAQGLQPVFYHNALDIITLAALTTELAKAVGQGGGERVLPSLDLFSLSRIYDRAGVTEQSLSACQQALATGLPEEIETRALFHLAAQHKRRCEYDVAVEIWSEVTRRKRGDFSLEALEELAIHFEHRRRDYTAAINVVEKAIELLRDSARESSKPSPTAPPRHFERFTYRLKRLRRKSERAVSGSLL